MPSIQEASKPPDNLKNMVPVTAPAAASYQQPPAASSIPDYDPLSLAPAPSVLATVPDGQRQWYRKGVSQYRISPLPSKANPAINASARGIATQVTNNTIQEVIASGSLGGGGVTSVGLTAPSVLFLTPVPGSPVTSAGVLSLGLLDEPQNFVFAGPGSTAGTIALDAALGTVTPQSAGTSQTINASGVSTQANDFAILAIGWQDGNFSSSANPDASWTSIFGFPTINTGEGVWWKMVPAAGAVSATASVTTTGNPALAATIVTAKTSGGTPAIRQSAQSVNVGIGALSSSIISYTSNVLAGSMLFMVTVQYSRFSPWAVTDSKGNIWVQISSTSIQTPNGGFPNNVRTQTVWATPSGSAGPNTITIQSTFNASLSASFFIFEVTNLAAPVQTPIFRPLVPADIPGMSTGLMSPQFGGTGSNLAATGGAHQFIAQPTAGGVLAPQQPAFTDLSGNIAVSQINSGTNASSATFLRGDNTWAAPLGGVTVKSGSYTAVTGDSGKLLAFNTTSGLVQTAKSDYSSRASIALPFASNNAAGNMIVVLASNVGTNPAGITISDTRGNTYVPLFTDITMNGNVQAGWYALNSGAGPNTVTVSWTGAVNSGLAIAEYLGPPTTLALDQSGKTTGSGNWASSSLTTTTAQQILVDFAVSNGVITATNAPFTQRAAINSGGNTFAELTDDIVSSTGTFQATGSASGNYVNFLATFKISGTGGSMTLTLPAVSPNTTWNIFVQNFGAGTVIVSPNGLLLDGLTSSVTLAAGKGIVIFTDGTNYFSMRGGS